MKKISLKTVMSAAALGLVLGLSACRGDDALTEPVAGALPNKAWAQRMTGIMLVRVQSPGDKDAHIDEGKFNSLTSYLRTVWLNQTVNGERCWRATFKFDGQYYLTLAGHGGGHDVYHNLVFFSSLQPPPEVARVEAKKAHQAKIDPIKQTKAYARGYAEGKLWVEDNDVPDNGMRRGYQAKKFQQLVAEHAAQNGGGIMPDDPRKCSIEAQGW